MTVVAFPTSGLTRPDLRVLEAFCRERRLRDVPSYLSVGELEPEQPGQGPLRHASIKDAPGGRTVFVVDRSEGVYRVRYWHSIARHMALVARHRSLARALQAVPDWPGRDFRRSRR